MLKKNRMQPKKIVGTVFGGLLIGIPAIPLVASAQGSQVLNPCPRIYYEEPFNSTRLAPEGCPPNEATRLLTGRSNGITLNQRPRDTVAGERSPGNPGANQTPNRINQADAPTTPPGATSADPYYSPRMRDRTNPPVTPPLPANRSQPVATIATANQPIEVRLKNNTNTVVTYESPGYTGRKPLEGGKVGVLPSLPLPATIAVYRGDDGFVKLTPVTTDEPGVLEVTIDEDAKPLDDNQGVLRIQKDGQVFLN